MLCVMQLTTAVSHQIQPWVMNAIGFSALTQVFQSGMVGLHDRHAIIHSINQSLLSPKDKK